MPEKVIDFSIVDINLNKTFLCEKNCYYRKNCNRKWEFSMSEPVVGSLIATEIIVDVQNRTNSLLKMDVNEWYCIDEKSYGWKSREICDAIWRGRCSRLKYGFELPPNCTIRIYLYFPELINDVASVLYLTKDCVLEVDSKTSKVHRNTISLDITKSDVRVQPVVNRLNTLERLYAQRIFSLTPTTIEKIELDICSKQIEIKQMIDELPLVIGEVVRGWFDQIETSGERNLRVARDLLNLSKSDSISYLYSLDPRDFEEWTGDLFRALGYEVTVTPYSGDGGVDVICTKDTVTIGVQCKRYNGVVSDDVIYDLHKSLGVHHLMEGCVVTTGFFSVTAINAAKEYGIKLYDRTNLADLIKNALK